MEAEEEVIPIRVYLKCPDCNDTMIKIDQHTYKCSHCYATEISSTQYPYIKYVRK